MQLSFCGSIGVVQLGKLAKVATLPSAIFLALGLAGCGEKKADENKPTQIVAKVNDAELSVHQLNFALQGLQETDPERIARLRKAALERLVEQEVIVQDAVKKKLDRDPLVRNQLDAARRDILVRNHLQNLGVSLAVPSDDLVSKYYVEHPELFKERYIYQFAEFYFPRVPPNWPEIEKALVPAKSIQEVLVELRKKGINLPLTQNVIRSAEELPQNVVKGFVNIKDGEVVVYSKPPGIVIGQILARRLAPIDEVKAKPAIIAYLMSQSKGDLVQSQVRKMMDTAKVSYVGEFSKDAKEAKAIIPEKAGVVDVEAIPKDTKKESLEKGLKALK
jgi:EpsD family peptidyl-prolyl cis-trans isomerase